MQACSDISRLKEIVECTETVVDACLNITTAPDNNVTEDMLNTLDEEIKKTINLFEVNEKYDAYVATKAA